MRYKRVIIDPWIKRNNYTFSNRNCSAVLKLIYLSVDVVHFGLSECYFFNDTLHIVVSSLRIKYGLVLVDYYVWWLLNSSVRLLLCLMITETKQFRVYLMYFAPYGAVRYKYLKQISCLYLNWAVGQIQSRE